MSQPQEIVPVSLSSDTLYQEGFQWTYIKENFAILERAAVGVAGEDGAAIKKVTSGAEILVLEGFGRVFRFQLVSLYEASLQGQVLCSVSMAGAPQNGERLFFQFRIDHDGKSNLSERNSIIYFNQNCSMLQMRKLVKMLVFTGLRFDLATAA